MIANRVNYQQVFIQQRLQKEEQVIKAVRLPTSVRTPFFSEIGDRDMTLGEQDANSGGLLSKVEDPRHVDTEQDLRCMEKLSFSEVP